MSPVSKTVRRIADRVGIGENDENRADIQPEMTATEQEPIIGDGSRQVGGAGRRNQPEALT
jgi:hypothetical protein